MSEERPATISEIIEQFRRALGDCQRVYEQAAQEYAAIGRESDSFSADRFAELMLDLQRGLVVKIFVEVAQSDWHFSAAERELAVALIQHVWKVNLEPDQVRPAIEELVEKAGQLTWDTLLQPFERLGYLREWAADVEAVVVRLASLVAKVDGKAGDRELERVKWIRSEVRRLLVPISLDEAAPLGSAESALHNANAAHHVLGAPAGQIAGEAKQPTRQADEFASALGELRALIGLQAIKKEIEELANFLLIEQQREARGLPRTTIGLHMVFSGKPGTGKTTVARLLGRIYRSLGVLKRGHVIETDRSGFVAGYAGQTATKTHLKIDEALDGVLFIDEAYSLVAERGDDPYGLEALQVLLKRMEDDRARLIVILAGYTRPMRELLSTNPGLSSRFTRQLEFPDYLPDELGQIFERMCQQHHYVLPAETRLKLLLGFSYLANQRREDFGNGRLARNVFETAIRRLANRIVAVSSLTTELLTRVEPDDISMDGVPQNVWDSLQASWRLSTVCPKCRETLQFRPSFLGESVRCKRCGEAFTSSWGHLL